MGDAKIEIRVGEIQFSGQGEQDWVAKQLDKMLAQAEKLVRLAPPAHDEEDDDGRHKPMDADPTIGKKTLPVFLNEKGAAKNQVKSFWLQPSGSRPKGRRECALRMSQAR